MSKNGFKVFDSDLHVIEPVDLWQRYIAPEYRSRAPVGLVSPNIRELGVIIPGLPEPRHGTLSGKNFERLQKLYAEDARRGFRSDVELEAMDHEGIDVAVLFPSRTLSVLSLPDMDPGWAHAIARAYNDWLYEFCHIAPERMLGAGMVSVYDIGHAVEETYRVVDEYGFRAICLRANKVNGKPWHDPYYEPLWNALEKLDVPLTFHEAGASHSRHMSDYFNPSFGLGRITSQPLEQMLALTAFVAGGVLERHPRLRVAHLEANCSWVPWLLWRMDECWELEGDLCMPALTMKPSDYFHRQCIVSIEPDELPAVQLMPAIGSDNVVFSTDYPHTDSRYPHAIDTFLELPLSSEGKRKILWDNCSRFYKVGLPAAV
jgi:predicted TIM-barrel fold metal-dependent hydrolase